MLKDYHRIEKLTLLLMYCYLPTMGKALPIKMVVTDKQCTAITPGIAGFGKIGL